MLHVLVSPEQVQALEEALGGLEGLTVHVARDSAPATKTDAQGVILEVVGSDRPGIVQQVAHLLSDQGANVEELSTEISSAPMSGGLLFHARIRVSLPSDMDVEVLREALEGLSDDLMVSLAE